MVCGTSPHSPGHGTGAQAGQSQPPSIRELREAGKGWQDSSPWMRFRIRLGEVNQGQILPQDG